MNPTQLLLVILICLVGYLLSFEKEFKESKKTTIIIKDCSKEEQTSKKFELQKI